jgi:hypothetical protein
MQSDAHRPEAGWLAIRIGLPAAKDRLEDEQSGTGAAPDRRT